MLPISAKLELVTVLRDVVRRASACARYGMIAAVDEAGATVELMAPRLSTDERRHTGVCRTATSSSNISGISGGLRLADVPAYLRSLGYPGS